MPNEEPRHKRRRDLEDDRVDDEPEDSKREHRKGKGDDLYQQTERGVQESEHDRRDQRCAQASDKKSGNNVGDNKQAERHQQPANECVDHAAERPLVLVDFGFEQMEIDEQSVSPEQVIYHEAAREQGNDHLQHVVAHNPIYCHEQRAAGI